MELERFAFSTSAFSREPLSKALKQIAKFGFKGVEILADKPHLWLDSFSARNLSELQSQLEKLGLFVSNVNANTSAGFWTDAPPEPIYEPSLISPDKSQREWRIAYIKKALRVGQQLATPCVSVTSGRAQPGMPPEKAQKLLEESLARVIEAAESFGIRLALECDATLLIERSEELLALLKRINSSCFGACVNVAHAEIAGEDPVRSIRMLKGRILNLQLADVRDGKHFTRVPGEGSLDFRAIFRELNATGYTGPITWCLPDCADHADEACEKTLRYVRSLTKLTVKDGRKRKAAAS